MKKIAISCVLIGLISFQIFAKRESINKIIARVNDVIILESELKDKHADKEVYTLDDAIAKELYFQEASKRKLLPTSIDIDKQVSAYKVANNLKTDEELEKNLKTHGFSLKRYKGELIKLIAINNLLQAEVRSRVFVTSQEVEKYYNENPIWQEERYILKTCIVPFDSVKNEKELLAKKDSYDWLITEWIKKSQLSKKMSFVSKMKKDETKFVKTEYGYQLIELLDKKELQKESLADQYVAIEKKLKDEKMAKFEDEYKNELLKVASIEYLS